MSDTPKQTIRQLTVKGVHHTKQFKSYEDAVNCRLEMERKYI